VSELGARMGEFFELSCLHSLIVHPPDESRREADLPYWDKCSAAG
jgi:hypothetical protein